MNTSMREPLGITTVSLTSEENEQLQKYNVSSFIPDEDIMCKYSGKYPTSVQIGGVMIDNEPVTINLGDNE